jgi:hypothetical protein
LLSGEAFISFSSSSMEMILDFFSGFKFLNADCVLAKVVILVLGVGFVNSSFIAFNPSSTMF